MTKEQKIKAINDRIGNAVFDTPEMISIFLITELLDRLSKKNLIESSYHLTNGGTNIAAICNEFDWEVNDEEITQFCKELIPEDQIDAFIYWIKNERDKKNG